MNIAREKITFVSSADSNYFPLLQELIHSIRRFEQSKDMAICVFDVGLTEEQHEIIAAQVDRIVKPGWPKDIPEKRIKGNEFYKACVNRPYINQFFEGYDYYFWLDADTWVQDWRSVELFIEGARRGKLAITSSIDRNYDKFLQVRWFGPFTYRVRSFYMGNTCRAYDLKTAKKIFDKPLLCAGAFCLHKDAPHWGAWQKTIQKTLEKGNVFTAEQLSLGMVVYLQGHGVEILPSYAQWQAEAKPLWDADRQAFVEYYLPNETIGIVHITGHDKMRINRSTTKGFDTLQGGTVEHTYRYPFFNGETGEEETRQPNKNAVAA